MFYYTLFLFTLLCVVPLCYTGWRSFLRNSLFADAGSGAGTKIRSGDPARAVSRGV